MKKFHCNAWAPETRGLLFCPQINQSRKGLVKIMLIYIAIILTIHTLIGLYSVITSRIEQKRHRKMILNEIEERTKFFDELEKKLMENKEPMSS